MDHWHMAYGYSRSHCRFAEKNAPAYSSQFLDESPGSLKLSSSGARIIVGIPMLR